MTYRQAADLHVHTTASDGTLTPEEVVQVTARVKLAAVAITDHDTVNGIAPALMAAADYGITVVPGVEINTDIGEDEVHVLGYYIDHESDALCGHLAFLREKRRERAKLMVERLNELGVEIDFDRVDAISGGGTIGRPHVARALVEAGHVLSMNAAFGKYLIVGAPAYVPRYKLTPFQAIDIIRQAGGVAVFAHPGLSKHDELIPRLAEHGLQGIEVYHTDHSTTQIRHYLEIARRYGLIATGGSDSHGPDNVKTVTIGNVVVGIAVVHKLRELSQGPVPTATDR